MVEAGVDILGDRRLYDVLAALGQLNGVDDPYRITDPAAFRQKLIAGFLDARRAVLVVHSAGQGLIALGRWVLDGSHEALDRQKRRRGGTGHNWDGGRELGVNARGFKGWRSRLGLGQGHAKRKNHAGRGAQNQRHHLLHLPQWGCNLP